MSVESKMPPSKQIRNFLFVIGSGALLGLAIVIFLVQYYGPTGYYKAKNVLMAPDVLEKMWYTTANTSTRGNQSRFVFKGIEYLYFNDKTKRWETVNVPLSKYGQFYQLVGNDISEKEPDETLSKNYDSTPPQTIMIKAAAGGEGQFKVVNEVFQQVQFASDGSHYRVQLHDQDPSNRWAYFKHEGIREKSQKVLMP